MDENRDTGYRQSSTNRHIELEYLSRYAWRWRISWDGSSSRGYNIESSAHRGDPNCNLVRENVEFAKR